MDWKTLKIGLFLLFIMFIEIRILLLVDAYLKSENIQNDYILFGISATAGCIIYFLTLFIYIYIKKKIKNKFFKGAIK